MKVLVTGGSGFIGSHVVDRLRERGIEARVYDMVMPTFRKDIEYYQGSLLDLMSLRMAMNGVSAVFHLAAVADVKDVFEEPHYSESINVRGTVNVLEAARLSRVPRVVYGSTTWVYSDVAGDEVNEDTPLSAPSHLYTATKLAGEYYCRAYANLYKMEAVVLRYGIPYGPRARAGAVVPIFVRKALKGEPITIAGDGAQFRRFVYVEDLAEGNVLALKPDAKNKTYNLDGTETVTIRRIAETIQKTLGSARIEYIPARPGDFAGKVVDSSRARRELGWEPKVPFEEGVRRYIDWVRGEDQKKASLWSQVDPALRS